MRLDAAEVVDVLQFIAHFFEGAGADGFISGEGVAATTHAAVEAAESFGRQVVERAAEDVYGDAVTVVDRAGGTVDGGCRPQPVFPADGELGHPDAHRPGDEVDLFITGEVFRETNLPVVVANHDVRPFVRFQPGEKFRRGRPACKKEEKRRGMGGLLFYYFHVSTVLY